MNVDDHSDIKGGIPLPVPDKNILSAKQSRRVIEKALEMQGMIDLSSAHAIYNSVYPRNRNGSVTS